MSEERAPRPTSFTVPASLAGERVDRAAAAVTGSSRSQVARLCREGGVVRNGRAVPARERLVEGDVLEIALVRSEPVVVPEPGPLEVRHVDADVIVVVKPAGLVVHPGAGHTTGTLVNRLAARFPEVLEVGDDSTRPGIVHRLDRDTSGLMVVARSEPAYAGLVRDLAARRVERCYRALVWGQPPPRGAIDAPIGRSVARRTRMSVRAGGREARTRYAVVQTFDEPEVALVECQLETGRTHQVRVHLAAIGHPVVGDDAYGGRRVGIPLDRPFLHAARLGFDHPVNGARLTFDEPLTADLGRVLRRLDARRS